MGTSRVTVEDVKAGNVVDNGDGTITITLVPVATEMSEKGMDPQDTSSIHLAHLTV